MPGFRLVSSRHVPNLPPRVFVLPVLPWRFLPTPSFIHLTTIAMSHSLESITPRRRSRLEQVLGRRQSGFTIVLENIWDPHNVSAILRTADAVGILDVHLLYHIEPFPNLVKVGKQSSASAKQWLTFHLHTSVAECYAALRREGFTIYASALTENSMDLYEIDGTARIALVLGNESRGISDDARSLADGVYVIPMMGMVQSLNVSVAAAVSLYEVMRQRSAAGLYNSPSLPDPEYTRLLEQWGRY